MRDYQEVRTSEHEQGLERRVTTFKVTQVIWLLLGLLEAVLALRLVFKLIAVNPANTFANLLYTVTDLFLKPFASLTSAPAAGGMVLEISTIIAMIVYLLIAWAIDRIVNVLFYRPRGPVVTRQTVVAEHLPEPGPIEVQRTTTDRTVSRGPIDTAQTTVTERTNTQTRDQL